MAYLVLGFSLAYTGLVFFITSMTCGTFGESAEKCDIRVWYLTMIGEGSFSKDLTSQQQAMKMTIEGMIQKSTENQELSQVDCSVLAMYEEMFRDPKTEKALVSGNDPKVNGTKLESEIKTEADSTGKDDSETVDDPTEMEFDETEMVEDETESAETEGTDQADDTLENGKDKTAEALMNITSASNSSDVQEGIMSNGTAGTSSNDTQRTHQVAFWTTAFKKCNKQMTNKTGVSCIFLNAVNFQCPISSTHWMYPQSDTSTTQEVPVTNSDDTGHKQHSGEAQLEHAGNDIDGKTVNLGDAAAGSRTNDGAQNDSKLPDEAGTDSKIEKEALDKYNSAEISGGKPTEANDRVNTHKATEQEESTEHVKPEISENGSDRESVRLSPQDHSVNSIDFNQFRLLIEQKTGEYTFKIQTLETQIIRLENQLLMEKLNKQNHSSSFNRLENQILRLENELLKMTLGYDEIKAENENIKKKQKNFLELDYVKRPGENGNTSDNSTKHFELISKHQNKISELTEHLRNQSHMIEKIRGQSDFLEEQNRSLFQIVMNQTMLVSQMMKKVQSLSDANLKQQMEQHQLQQKVQIALASSHAMEDLDSLVSDRRPDRPNPRVFDTTVKESPPTDVHHLEKIRKATRRSADNDDENIELHKYLKQMSPLTLYGCKQSKRCKLKCQLNSFLVGKCLPSDNSSVVEEGFMANRGTGMGKKDEQKQVTSSQKMETREGKDVETKQSSTDSGTGQRAESEQGEKLNRGGIQDNDSSVLKADVIKGQPLSEDTKSSKEPEQLTTGDKRTSDGETSNEKDGDKQTNVNEANEKLEEKLESPGMDGSKEQQAGQENKPEVAKTGDSNDTKLSSDSVSASSKETQSAQQKLEESSANNKTATNEGKEDGKPESQPTKVKDEKDKTGKPKPTTKKVTKKLIVQRIPPLYNVTKQVEPKDCYDYYRRSSGNKKDGQYKIRLHGTKDLVPVFCDMKNGGWTVIQRRQDGTVNFFRPWEEYRKGFGGVYGEHWIGNDIIHRLTNQAQYELRVDMMDWNKTKKHALYEYIRIEDEAEGYRLHVDGYSGDAGDGFSKHHGEKFSTKDKDNDKVVKEFGGSCANRFKGAWWYYKCYASNLNGKFYKKGIIPEKLFDGITWKPWTGPNISLKKVEIKVRPILIKQ